MQLVVNLPSVSSGNFFSYYVTEEVWNDVQKKTSGVCSYFSACKGVGGWETLAGLQQQLYVSRTGLSGLDLALMKSSRGGWKHFERYKYLGFALILWLLWLLMLNSEQ